VPEVVSKQVSLDGTRKYLMRIAGGHEVEVVYIPEEDRGTLCISSQVGCTLTCSFCHTGTQKLVRNLTAGEIIGQVMVARDDLDEWPRPGEGSGERPRLIVQHRPDGDGRAALQFRECARCDEDRDGWRGHRHLAPAHHAVDVRRGARDRALRRGNRLHAGRVVPRHDRRGARPAGADQQAWNIEVLLDALRAYPKASNSERITFEYVMLKDVNDSDEDARRLVKLIAGIPAKINLIPFNEWPGAPYERSDWARIERFADIIYKAGYASPIRTPRGEDIMAACGQLKSATERARKSRAEIAAETGLQT
jgi:23S rRNA (adenine2503-C2)-methyltransferase